MDKKKLIYSILKEIEQGNSPNNNYYGIELEEFGTLLEMIQSEGLIQGAKIQRAGRGNRIVYAFTDQAKIQMKGLNYLDENSAFAKTYKGIKEVLSWLKP